MKEAAQRAPAADESATRGVSPPGAPPTSPSTVTSTPLTPEIQAAKEVKHLVVVVRRVLRPVDRRQVHALLDQLPERRHLAEPRDVHPQ